MEMLEAREARARRQRELLDCLSCPVVSFTMNIPGPVKNGPVIRRAFREGLLRLDAALDAPGLGVVSREEIDLPTGCEALWAVRGPGRQIKELCAAIEDQDPLGRLFDLDVLDPERGATVSTFVLTIVVLIFGEVTPKSLAKEMPETVATAVAPALSLLMLVFTPLTWLFSQWKRFLGHFVHSTEEDTITEGELMTMVSEAENDGELTDRESELIRSAIEFDDVEVEEILTPRVDVIAVEDDMPLEEVAQTFAESGYSRLPVYHDTIDNIIGVVHEKDFYMARLKKETKLEDLVKPTLYTTGSTQISQLLRTLREQHHHMAVVVDEYGGTEGIITLEDILEELVGEIWDEHDEVTEDFRKQSDGSWIVLGSAGVDDLYERLGLPEDEDIDSNTVNGLVQEKTCRLPKVGDRFTLGSYDGVVTRTAKRRVTEVRLTPAEKPDSKKDEEEKGHFGRMTSK